MTIQFHTGKVVSIPSTWHEIQDQQQYLTVVGEYVRYRDGEQDYHGFCVNLTKKLLDIRFKPKGKAAENLFLIAQHMRGYFNEKEVDGRLIVEPSLEFTQQFIPEYEGHKGPSELLTDMTWMQFMDANKHMQDLDALVATLYGGSPEKWPKEVKEGIRLWYQANLNYISSENMVINGITVNFAPLFSSVRKENDLGMIAVHYDLAASGVFGNVDQVAERNLYDVLMRLYQLKMEQRNDKAD
jgi:hypothetical protein